MCVRVRGRGKGLRGEAAWIINKVERGFLSAIGKWLKVNASAHSAVVNGALS